MSPWVAWLLPWLALGPPAAASSGRAEASREVVETPKLQSAEAQLRHAASRKSALRGTQGTRRRALQAEVLESYRAVRRHWPEAKEACAESAFRAGELLRASGDAQGARAEFELARAVEPRTSWRARAALEVAHVHRRGRSLDAALDVYLGVAHDPRAEVPRRDEAALWAGRVYAELGKQDEARRQWTAVAARAEDPLQRIEAWDELALALTLADDLEGAAGWIAVARETLADAALEETAQGERIQAALESMRAIRRLEQAVRARDDARRRGAR